MTARILLTLALMTSVVCADDFSREYSAVVKKAHYAAGWYSRNALKTGFLLEKADGEKRFEATLLMRPHGAVTRLDLDNGVSLGFDGKTAWITPAESDFEKPRFHALTWPYFIAAPYKLDDRGTKMEDLGKLQLNGREYDGARLTFESGVGDAPDDWYVLYRDPENGRLAAMGYIVTYGGKNSTEAAKESHAITYEDFKEVDGVPISTTWKFWNWTQEVGLGAHLMTARLSTPTFVERGDDAFAAPEEARTVSLPTAGQD